MTAMLKKISAAVFIWFLYSGYYQICAQNNTADPSDYSWLESSTSNENIIIIDYITAIDFKEKIEAVDSLSKRIERDFRFLIDYIYNSGSMKNEEREFLLYKILEKLITDRKSAEESGYAFVRLCRDIASFKDSALRKLIINRTDFLDSADAEHVLLNEALFFADRKESGGILGDELLEECRILFTAADKIDSIILDDYIQKIYEKYKNIPAEFRRF